MTLDWNDVAQLCVLMIVGGLLLAFIVDTWRSR